MTAELSYIDSLGGLWFKGALVGKAGSAFASTSTLHGGNEMTITALYAPMAHLGLILVPTGYADPRCSRPGTPYALLRSPVTNSAPPTRSDLAVARFQGKRVARIAALKAAR